MNVVRGADYPGQYAVRLCVPIFQRRRCEERYAEDLRGEAQLFIISFDL